MKIALADTLYDMKGIPRFYRYSSYSRLGRFRRIVMLPAIALLIVMFALPMSAQTHYVPRISVGAHGGVSLGRMGFSPGVTQSFLPGMTMGVRFRWAEERHVGIAAELNFSQRGWAENFGDDNDLNYSRRLTYIEIPIMTHIFFGSRRVNGFFNLGPQLGYMISDNISSNFDYASPASVNGFPKNRRTEQMSMEIKNRFDYGIMAGGGVEFYINPRNSIQIEARYYYGLGNIFPSSKSDTFAASRGSMITATVAYMFRLK